MYAGSVMLNNSFDLKPVYNAFFQCTVYWFNRKQEKMQTLILQTWRKLIFQKMQSWFL